LLLQIANARIDHAKQQIEQPICGLQAYSGREANGLEIGMSAAEIQFADRCRTVLADYKKTLDDEPFYLEEIQAERRSALAEARRKRQATDGLRERQLQNFREEVRREEQRQLDEMFVIRRGLSRSR